jgi:hypothetical protein
MMTMQQQQQRVGCLGRQLQQGWRQAGVLGRCAGSWQQQQLRGLPAALCLCWHSPAQQGLAPLVQQQQQQQQQAVLLGFRCLAVAGLQQQQQQQQQ